MSRVLITSGPTREPIDPIRFIANASSGRMGAALARVALERGHEVTVISGPAEAALPAGAEVVAVTTALEMLREARLRHASSDIVIGAAAVSDYRPASPLPAKRIRGAEPWQLELIPNPDLLASLGERKRPGQVHAGFALESAPIPEALERARGKLERKRLDWIVLNSTRTLGSGSGEFWIIPAGGEPEALGELEKEVLSRTLWSRLEGREFR